MVQISVAIAMGFLALHWLTVLPPYEWCIVAVILSAVIYCLSRNFFLILFSLSAFLAIFNANQYLNLIEYIPLQRTNLIIEVELSTLFNKNIPNKNFEADVLIIKSEHESLTSPLRLKIRWDNPPQLKQGQKWRLPVRMGRIVGRVNQAGYDAERYAISKNIHGKAVVTPFNSMIPTLLSSNISMRQRWLDRLTPLLMDKPYQGYLVALAFGLRDGLSQQDWLRLRDSGLAHLLVISGLHIGLAMIFGWWIGRLMRVFSPQTKFLIWLPIIVGLLIATSYAWLAGFSLPTMRALLMCIILGLLRMTRIHWLSWQVILTALVLCLFIDPFASYSAGFWLSFSAVTALLLIAMDGGEQKDLSSRQSIIKRFAKQIILLFKLQLCLLILMLPMQWWWFGGVSLSAPLTNLFSVPWISFVTAPLVMFGLLMLWLPVISEYFWQLADYSLIPIVMISTWSNGSWLSLPLSFQSWLLGGVVILLIGRVIPISRFKWLYCSVVLILACWSWTPSSTSNLKWQVLMLDVGHGLAVVIEKNGRAILYDTGNSWQQFSMAESVVAPVLRQLGIAQLDGFIISHADSDHASGSSYIERHFSPLIKRSSDYRDNYHPCIIGQSWHWQGLNFEVLWPPARVEKAANPHSCTVQIQAENGQGPTVLLTGDIDAASELMMLSASKNLRADILFVPHHGSYTSSTHTLLNTLKPELALVSIGKFNPWNLPSKIIQARYQSRDIQWLSTGENGQITLNIDGDNYQVKRQRIDYARDWFRPDWLIDHQ